MRGGALRHLRGRLRADHSGRGRSRHDPGRELARRTGRRHSSPDAELRAPYRGRAFHAGAPSIAGHQGGAARGHQDGREPCPCAGPVPQDHPPARHQAAGGRRHRRLGARGRGGRRQDPRRHRVAARRRDLCARHAGGGRRGRSPQHHPLHRAGARGEMGDERQRADHHHLPVPGAQRAGRALQGARRLRHQRRQHDQARKLHGRGQFLRHPVLCRRRGPSRGPQPGARAGGARLLLQRDEKILGVYPAHPFRRTFEEVEKFVVS